MIYQFAERKVEIRSLFPYVHQLCFAYRTTGEPDFVVATSPSDISYERSLHVDGERYGDAYLETLSVYRKIAEKMPFYDTFLFHGSCIAVDGAAYLFTAKSGTGKSTHTRLWRELLGDRAIMVNDDKPLLRVSSDGVIAYGTPWDGKHHLSANLLVPLRAICILERAEENWIEPATDALPMLLQQAYRPRDPQALRKTLALVDRLDVPLYHLGCNMDLSAARLAYETMRGNTL